MSRRRNFAHSYRSTGKYDVEQRPGESEMQYYRRLAKTADQRLVRLEALSHEKNFTGVKKMAYGRAMSDLEIFGGGTRFNTKPPEDRRLFKEKIMAMRYFLESPTSTKSGIVETYQERAKTLNKKYGTNFTWKDLADYFGKGKADKAARSVGGSKTALYAIGLIRKTDAALVKGIQSNKNVTMDGPVTDAAIALLRMKDVPGVPSMTKEKKEAIRKQLRSGKKKVTR